MDVLTGKFQTWQSWEQTDSPFPGSGCEYCVSRTTDSPVGCQVWVGILHWVSQKGTTVGKDEVVAQQKGPLWLVGNLDA